VVLVAQLSVIGVPSSAGAFAPGQELAPQALREAGLLEGLRSVCDDVEDLGDSAVFRWSPDRDRPRAQNVARVVEEVRVTGTRVAAALRAGRSALVIGGDCTIGVGTLAGAKEALGSVGLIYFDLHADMNTPSSVVEGALDWMGVAHMLALDGCDPAFAASAVPPDDLVLFGHSDLEATSWEREQIARLNLKRVPVEDVAQDPAKAARRALEMSSEACDRYLVHLDVDVIDFTDAPLSENTGRNKGLMFETALTALRGLLSSDRVAALTVTELNPVHAQSDEGLLERLVDRLTQAWT
jgi:arginase